MSIIKEKKMTAADVMKHNNDIFAEVEFKRTVVSEMHADIDKSLKKIIVPCELCGQDGEYRCLSCEENNYKGFDDPDYMHPKLT